MTQCVNLIDIYSRKPYPPMARLESMGGRRSRFRREQPQAISLMEFQKIIPDNGPTVNGFKQLRVRARALDQDEEGGSIDATFENAMANGVLYDDFSSPRFDPALWAASTLDFVREVSGGLLARALIYLCGDAACGTGTIIFEDVATFSIPTDSGYIAATLDNVYVLPP
jgi:hypothetical protein